jgi:putative ABC transport system permease protein
VTAARWTYRQLARLLPRAFREECGADLERAAVGCLERERAHRGRAGLAAAWARLVADTIATAIAVRRGADRLRAVPPESNAHPPHSRRGPVEAIMDNAIKDLRHAIRTLWRQPGFTLVTIVTLALGIGANTAVFSVLNGVILRPLPYPQPERLVLITSQFPNIGFDQFWISTPEFLEFRDLNQSFASVGGYSVGRINLGGDTPTRPNRGIATVELAPTLGVGPAAGRWFEPADAAPGAAPVAVLSWELWQREFAGAPDVIGRAVLIDAVSTQIVGVMPEGFDVHDEHVEIWEPLTIDPATLPNRRGSHFLYLVGRLEDGATMAAAEADVQRMLEQWATWVPQGHVPTVERHRLRLDPLKDDIVGSVQTALFVLQVAVGVVLLIACANLANLLIARADSRRREYAVRAALGASRWRLFQQLATEGLVLAAAAAALGVGLAWGGLQALLSVNPEAIPRSSAVTLDGTVLGFTLALAMATTLVFALVPLLHLAKDRVGTALRQTASRSSTGARSAVRSGLVVAEVALAVLLVVGAGLLIRSFVNLMRVDVGFDRSQLATFEVVLPTSTYNGQARVDFFTRLVDRVKAIPGVTTAAVTSGLPPLRQVDANDTDFEHIPNNRPPGAEPVQNVDFWQGVSVDYIDTLGIPMVDGRAFEPTDVVGAPVAIVNEELARRFFTDRSPIGQHVRLGFGDDIPWFTIVGVIKDVKQGGIDARAGTQLFVLNEQLPRVVGFSYPQMNLVLRSPLAVAALAPALHEAVHDLDASLPVVGLRSMDAVVGESMARPRFLTLLLALFASLALGLAAVGTYGILSYLVNERRQEIGIRMALGADRRRVLALVLARGLLLSGIGLLLGLGASVGLTRVLASMLFDVSPTDPATIALVTGVIAAVAVAACVVPALRAARVDPLSVLRD